jgi:hypothetical protein
VALKLQAEIGLDGTGFRTGMQKIQTSVNQLKTAFGTAFTVGALTSATRSIINFASEIKDTATRLQVSTDFIQELRFAAQQSGSGLSVATLALEKMGVQMQNAIENGGDAMQAFNRLGVSFAELKNNSPEDVFRLIGRNLQTMERSLETNSAVIQVFGRGGGRLVTVLKELAENSQKFKDTQPLVTEESINNIERLGDRVDGLRNKLKALAAEEIGSRISLFDGEWLAGTDEEYWNGKIRMQQLEALYRQRKMERGLLDPGAVLGPNATAEQLEQLRGGPLVTNAKPEKISTSFVRESDSLTRVGNFLGGAQSSLPKIAERANQILLSIDRKMTTLIGASSSGVAVPET